MRRNAQTLENHMPLDGKLFHTWKKGGDRIEGVLIGATVRSRTADILITSEVLYQLSYGGPSQEKMNISSFFGSCL